MLLSIRDPDLEPFGHRVDSVSVICFFSSHWNWDSPTPSPAGECAPSLVPGEGAHSLAGEGVGVSQLQRGDRHGCTLGIYGMHLVLFAYLDPDPRKPDRLFSVKITWCVYANL
jgi:hypothetical protein